MRHAQHRKLPGIKIKRRLEMQQKLNGIPREDINARHHAASELGPDAHAPGEIGAPWDLEAAVAERAALTEQHFVAIRPQIGVARRLCPIAYDHAGNASRLARSTGAGGA